jgi:hypothetical protein
VEAVSDLLTAARAAGLTASADGDELVVRGPRRAHLLATALLDRKGEVLALLAAGDNAGRDRWIADPRPDLAGDSALWQRLLSLAYERDGEEPAGLFGALHGLRCCGAALATQGGRVRLSAGELGDEYRALRRAYLLPHTAALRALLQALCCRGGGDSS